MATLIAQHYRQKVRQEVRDFLELGWKRWHEATYILELQEFIASELNNVARFGNPCAIGCRQTDQSPE